MRQATKLKTSPTLLYNLFNLAQAFTIERHWIPPVLSEITLDSVHALHFLRRPPAGFSACSASPAVPSSVGWSPSCSPAASEAGPAAPPALSVAVGVTSAAGAAFSAAGTAGRVTALVPDVLGEGYSLRAKSLQQLFISSVHIGAADSSKDSQESADQQRMHTVHWQLKDKSQGM